LYVSRLIGNPGDDASPLQLPSVHHNPSCAGCARDAEENRMWKESLVKKNVAKERSSVVATFDKVKK